MGTFVRTRFLWLHLYGVYYSIPGLLFNHLGDLGALTSTLRDPPKQSLRAEWREYGQLYLGASSISRCHTYNL